MYKYELHAHTSECNLCAHLSGRELVRLYKDAGYDGMVITDHYFRLFYADWFSEELKGLTHQQQIARWLKGFREAREEGEKIGFTVMPGAEVRFDHRPNDYLLYGVDEDFFYNAPRLNALKDIRELLALMPEGACVVQAHPFRDGMIVETPPRGLFAVEGFNGGNDEFRNRLAREYACHYRLAMTSGSDIHDTSRLAKGGIMTEHRIQTPEALCATLRSGKYRLIENY